MSFLKPYQNNDSSAIAQDDVNGLDLIEELDDTISLDQPKKKSYKLIKKDSAAVIDTFYGIKNEGAIPVRNAILHTVKETPIEKSFSPTLLPQYIANWQVIILIVAIIMLGIAKAFSSNRFKQSIRGLFKYGVALEITREEKVFFHRSNIFFTLIHLLSTSLLLYQIKELIQPPNIAFSDFIFYLLIIAVLMLIYIVKYLFAQILFYILNDQSIVSEYIFNVSLYNNLLGILFLPILCLTYFSDLEFSFILLYLLLPLTVITFGLRLIRLYFIGKSKGISYFYIFLYICTLEILPLVVLLRIFIFK